MAKTATRTKPAGPTPAPPRPAALELKQVPAPPPGPQSEDTDAARRPAEFAEELQYAQNLRKHWDENRLAFECLVDQGHWFAMFVCRMLGYKQDCEEENTFFTPRCLAEHVNGILVPICEPAEKFFGLEYFYQPERQQKLKDQRRPAVAQIAG